MTSKRKVMGMLLVAATVAWAGQLTAGEIYKVVDADGNVTFTDQPPEPGATPITLPGLSVVERPSFAADNQQQGGAGQQDDQQLSMRDLQRMYRGFRLVSPAPEQSFWGTGNTATIAWQAGAPLQPGMQVQLTLNGKELPPSTSATMTTEPMDRGEHQVSARLLSQSGEVVATAGPVVFFIRQQFQQPRPQPRVGG
jgi:hypothetical protein